MEEKYTIPSYGAGPTSNLCASLSVNVRGMDSPDVPLEKYGYDSILNVYRNQIDAIDSEKWKKVRWFINDFDFLVKDPVINRAFYKYWEIINEFDIFEKFSDDDIIFHCAEAPGGFIQGSNIFLQLDNKCKMTIATPPRKTIDVDGFTTINKKPRKGMRHKIFTISLNKDLPQYKSYNLPSYNKNIVKSHVCITYGKDNTGDINNMENIFHIQKLAKKKFFLVTADGGFDEGIDFNHKEQLHYYLILNEILAAVLLGKKGGNFILKMFDIFTESSIHMLFLLSNMYEEMFIYKPRTSRPTNSEKYIVCKGFLLDNRHAEMVAHRIALLSGQIKKINNKFCAFTLFKSIPESFASHIKEINSNILKVQCDFLTKAVQMCNDPTFLDSYELQLQRSIEKRKETFKEWEDTYNLGAYV